MFTGLIQAVGRVHHHEEGLLIKGYEAFAPITIGESVAVDGVCLTAKRFISDGFFADVSEETLSRTTLGAKADTGDFVNLEPALRFSDRLGGHLVSGHVDGLGEVLEIDPLQNSWVLNIRWQKSTFARFVCEKASISLNGISLTVAGLDKVTESFWIAVIPHTWSSTNLRQLQVGELVNLEVDLMAKYAERLLKGMNQLEIPPSSETYPLISKEWLAQNGWGSLG